MMIEKYNYSLLKHNTFGMSVSAKRFVEYSTKNELKEFIKNNQEEIVFHLGAGSNILFTEDFDGTILHSKLTTIELIEENETSVLLKVGGGIVWDDFVKYCIEHHYFGLENLSYIPGEVGASAVQNIGAYGVEVEEFIEKVEAVNMKTSEEKNFTHQECKYAYRNSVFKDKSKEAYAVTHVYYRLMKSFSPNLSYKALNETLKDIPTSLLTADVIRTKVIEIRKNKLPDPNKIGNGGSFFKNTIIPKDLFIALQTKYPAIPYYKVEKDYKVPTAWFIDQCGWKGKRRGDAGVCTTQALILVNYGKATGKEIKDLSLSIAFDVKKKFGVNIYPEINIL